MVQDIESVAMGKAWWQEPFALGAWSHLRGSGSRESSAFVVFPSVNPLWKNPLEKASKGMPHLMPQVLLHTIKMEEFANTMVLCNYFIILVFLKNLIACTSVHSLYDLPYF